jgi:hypothetical protein
MASCALPFFTAFSGRLRESGAPVPRMSLKYWLMVVAILEFFSLSPAHATVPEFSILVDSQMVVISVSTTSENQQILSELPTIEMRQRLTEYLSHRLKEENLSVVVANMGAYQGPPAGVPSYNVVWVFVRADLTTATAGQHQVVVGAVSVLLRRELSQSIESYLSHKPMTFFVVEGNRNDLESKVVNAAQDQIEKSVIEPLLSLRK